MTLGGQGSANGFIKEAIILPAFRGLHPTTCRLLEARSRRSIGHGALVVDFALYLHTLHWGGLAIGLVLSGSGLFSGGLSMLVGLSSDRLRRKPFLLSYEFLSLLCGMAALLSADPLILSLPPFWAGLAGGGRSCRAVFFSRTGLAGRGSGPGEAWVGLKTEHGVGLLGDGTWGFHRHSSLPLGRVVRGGPGLSPALCPSGVERRGECLLGRPRPRALP